jgi:FlaG/FlaF family flagellin (archaellin)
MRSVPPALGASKEVPGQGWKARTLRSSSAAGRRPVEHSFLLAELVCVGDALGRLVHRLDAPPQQAVEGRHDQPRAKIGQAVVHALGGVGGGNRRAFRQQHRAGIETFVHAHDGDAGLGVAGEDGAMDGGGAAPARQQRSMDVDAAEDRRIEEAFGQDMAVGDDDGGIEVERLEDLRLLFGLQGARRADRQTEFVGELMDGCSSLLLAATRGLGGPGVDADDIVTGFGQGTEGRHGEGGGAEERNLHRRTL